jgi:enterochelin esterase-like enzyme
MNETYSVLYILHGGGEDERGWATQGKTDLILDNLIAEKKAEPMIVVMPDGNVDAPGFGENTLRMFERELKQCIIPVVEQNYRADTGQANRALAGLSMGGIQTLYTGMNNTDLFAYLGVFSSGWIMPAQSSLADSQYEFMKQNLDRINGNIKQLWIAMGGMEDIAYNNCQVMMSRFDDLKVRYTYSEYPGGHTWPVWRNNLYNFAQLLFRQNLP